MGKHKTPMLDELENGPWPSFVSDIKQQVEKGKHILKDAPDDLLGVLEMSYEDKVTHWKHGGIVGVFGYGGGIIGRYCDQPQQFPGVAHFHTVRVNQPSSKYYTTKFLRELCDLWDRHGSGLTNMHGSTGDIVFLGTTTDHLEPLFYDMTHELNQDLGGSGSNLRTPECCLGMSRCEFACYDSQEACHQMTNAYQEELHRPAFPYKFKFKFDACPNGCVASIARSDMSVIGTWRDDIRINQEAVKAYVGGELKPNAGAHSSRDWGKFDIIAEVINLCPTNCMCWDGSKLEINNAECVRCMHCLNVMPRALRIGEDRGASILFGAKAPILEGAQMSTLTVPFMKMEPPFDELKELIEKVWDWWMEEGKNRERLGELIQRKSMQEFLRVIELEPDPRMVDEPRSNPYIFWKEEEVEGGWTRDIEVYRTKHPR
ncbi:dissimilatory-type sulfite reductase subunit alpha [Desulfomonile tiedjei]|uniref:Dissimilatory sulfite reductase alpha subunit n=1 Tax=Desulfomonile tiedjei (strain ATCC 49306 / DSM 6799 / DCB-1) TaxID=706587 RepID=I4C3X6_DESTA|nr:dissimilatory-type sulfite reductase subunit alpha [Desulfomonile tiedjei]AFM24267.1 dissimilatory sulfite reductase alpha subunit [Desulfomonile tiedjei DSM 6799]